MITHNDISVTFNGKDFNRVRFMNRKLENSFNLFKPK